jgi:energy-coupling factor transport system substrate-specific component
MKSSNKSYWTPGELIVIGTFAGLIKASTILIALAGGGMNPVTLVLKNTVATSLLIILVYKVNKLGVLTLFSVISSIVALLLMGGNPMSIAGAIVAGIVCDAAMSLTGMRHNTFVLLTGVALYDLLSRGVALGYSFFIYQENIKLFIMGAIVVAFGYLGCLMGLWSGIVFVKELKHAGIIRE